MLGGFLGEKLFTGIAKLFGRDKKAKKSDTAATTAPAPQMMLQDTESEPVVKTAPKARESYDPVRLDASIDCIPYANMHKNLRVVKDEYEAAYKKYVQAAASGNQAQAQAMLNAFVQQRERYRRALGAYSK